MKPQGEVYKKQHILNTGTNFGGRSSSHSGQRISQEWAMRPLAKILFEIQSRS
jgi:hypothetical protein